MDSAHYKPENGIGESLITELIQAYEEHPQARITVDVPLSERGFVDFLLRELRSEHFTLNVLGVWSLKEGYQIHVVEDHYKWTSKSARSWRSLHGQAAYRR